MPASVCEFWTSSESTWPVRQQLRATIVSRACHIGRVNEGVGTARTSPQSLWRPPNLLKSTASWFKTNPAFLCLFISGDATVHIDILVWQVGAIDCDSPLNKDLCLRLKVESFPTLKTVSNKGWERVFANYTGPRDAVGMTEYLVGKQWVLSKLQ